MTGGVGGKCHAFPPDGRRDGCSAEISDSDECFERIARTKSKKRTKTDSPLQIKKRSRITIKT